MFQRRNALLLVGAPVLVLGSVLFFDVFPGEPWWAEWLLGPILFYIGGPFTIVGVALYLFGSAGKSGNSSGLAKAQH